jgi:uncharacterized protein (DUF697 family)
MVRGVEVSGAKMSDEKAKIRKHLEEAKKDYEELGGWQTFKSGNWLFKLIQKSFNNYWERANVEYFQQKYKTKNKDDIAAKLISVAARNASLLGGVTGAAVSTDEIVGIVTAGEGGVGIPANVAIFLAAIASEAILLVRLQMQLVANLGKLYGVPLDPDDPEDILTILAFAVGGTAADAAGKFGMKVGAKLSAQTVKAVAKKETLEAMKRIGAKIGVKILQRTLVKYTVPLVSIGVGMTWNYLATKSVGKIAVKHFLKRKKESRI